MEVLTCVSCGHVNPAENRFCAQCGSRLAVICPECGRENDPDSRFCGQCGSKLHTAGGEPATPGPPAAAAAPKTDNVPAPSPPPGSPVHVPAPEERRLVTALFCDLAGFTPASERLDPEDVRDMQSEFFDAMRQQIERYAGTVEKYAGDAVLALFGVPIAHEDDAERAVLCALGMQAAIEPVAASARERWEVEPAIRVGVNTGEVVSGVWEAGGRQDVAVSGDAVNTAARLQAVAEPGQVLVSEETMRLTRRRIRYGERRDLQLKGKSGNVPVYPALSVRDQLGERWEEEARATPLVGRDRELVQLFDHWIRAQSGEGQLVTLIGEPGVGKSRLAAELVAKISSAAPVRLIRARCLSYGQDISLYLIADLLRSITATHEHDAPSKVEARLSSVLPALLRNTGSETMDEALDVLGEVLSLAPRKSLVSNAGAQIRRQSVIRSLRLVFAGLAERAPALLVLEDLQWIDQASQDVLRELMTDVPSLRLLVLATQRPGWIAPWNEWGWTERMALRPLREQDAATLAGAVLGSVNLSRELEQYVAERAGGNPFFVEELLRALDESGGLEQRDDQMYLLPDVAQRLPSTLTEILLARLDRLEGQVRTVAQVGSVIGRSFAVRLLAEVIGREQATLEMPLTALQEAEIAFPRHVPDLEYVFKHVTMREVAYNTLVQKRRRELHLQTARAIAGMYPAEEYAEMIAYHYERTNEHAEAVPWLERAGDRAAATYTNEAATANYKEARRRLELIEAAPADLARLDEKTGTSLVTAGRADEAVAYFEQAIAGYREAGDLESAGRVTAQLGIAHRHRGTPQEGLPKVEAMIAELEWRGPSRVLAALHVARANLYFLLGRYRDQLAASEQAGEIARTVGDDRLLGEAEMRRGTALQIMGRPDEGGPVLKAAASLSEASADFVTASIGLNNLASGLEMVGEFEDAREQTIRAVEAVERVGATSQICFMRGNLGGLLSVLGEWESAREQLERALVTGGRLGRTAQIANPLQQMGRLLMWQGEWDEGRRYLERALALTQQTGDRQLLEATEANLAALDIAVGQPDEAVMRLEPLVAEEDANLGLLLPQLAHAYLAKSELQRAEEIGKQAMERVQVERGNMSVILWVEGMIYLQQGRFDEADACLTQGLEVSREQRVPYMEARVLRQMGLLRRAQGRGEASSERLQESLAIFQRLGARKDVEQLQEDLANLPEPSPTRR